MHGMNEKVFKELQKFRELSSDKDYELVLSNEISYYDYERLIFILESLKLTYLESELIVKHINKFREEQEYLNKLNQSQEVYVDLERYNKWLQDFLDNIKGCKSNLRSDWSEGKEEWIF